MGRRLSRAGRVIGRAASRAAAVEAMEGRVLLSAAVSFGNVPDVTAGGAAAYTFSVGYSADAGIDASTVDTGDVTVQGPDGPLAVTAVTVSGGGRDVAAAYTAAPPGGTWDAADNGTYTVTARAGAVRDNFGDGTPAASATFTVNVPPPDNTPPASTAPHPANVTAAGVTHTTVVVTYTDAAGVDAGTIGLGDLVVTGPGGGRLGVSDVSVATGNGGRTATATYTVAAPGGAWDPADNGTYSVALAAGAVRDANGNATPARALTTFTVDVPAGDRTPLAAAFGALPAVTAAGGTRYTVPVTWSDGTAVDVGTIGLADVRVTGPGGGTLQVSAVTVPPGGNRPSVAASYAVVPPGGTWDRADNGTYTVTAVAGAVRDVAGNATAARTATFTVNIPAAPTPFRGTPAAVPGTVQAEDFDNGGEGVAYHDTTRGNQFGQYRQTDVDVRNGTVADTRAGEWVRYTVNVRTAGRYTLEIRGGNAGGAGGRFHVTFKTPAGTVTTGPLTAPGSTAAGTVRTTVQLSAGRQVMQVWFDAAGAGGVVGAFDWFRLTAAP